MKNFTKKRTLLFCKTLIVIGIIVLLFDYKAIAGGIDPPGATATVSGIVTCSNPTVTIIGESPATGVRFYWTGPNNFESMAQEAIVSLPGMYKLTVTDLSSGLASEDSVEVTKNIAQPNAEATVSDVLNCINENVSLNSVTNVTGADFHWIGPGGYSSYEQYPVVNVKGGYTLIVTDPFNGCASTATVYVEKDIEAPLASAYVSGELTCAGNPAELTSSSPTSDVRYNWLGPEGFNSPLQNLSATVPGNYTVTVTDTVNFCSSTASVEVIEDLEEPGAFITSTSSEITCATINATLTANSPSLSVTYSWSGPNGFGSTVQNPVVAATGNYILTVTGAGNACISRDTFNLVENKVRPGATATSSGEITCTLPSINLLGASPTQGVNYRWIGSNYSSLIQNPTTSNAGPYMLIVTNPNNGCTSSSFVSVVKNISPPASVTASNNGPLTCLKTSVVLTGSSSSSGVFYSWSGPGFTSSEQNPGVSAIGTYSLTVTNAVNGCTATSNTTVAEDIAPPADVDASNSGTLTCIVENINITASSSTSGVDYSWTGPENFSSTLKSPSISIPGKYYLAVTDPDNGCAATDSTTVSQDIISPADVIAQNSGPLTCTTLSTGLSGNTSTSNVTYNWTGPNNYASTTQNPVVGVAGAYILKVVSTLNGCISSDTTTLAQDTIKPVAVTAVNSGPLTCVNTNVTIEGSSLTLGVNYYWTGPNNFTSNLASVDISEDGTYNLTVENPINGCTSSAVTIVEADTLNPVGVNAANDGPITCSDNEVVLTGSTLSENVGYSWSGPDNFTADNMTTVVNQPGTYTVIVTDTVNGCIATASTTVTQDVDLPVNVTANNNGPLTCVNTSVAITASSATGGVSYSWSGPDNFSSDLASPSVSEKGTYTVTVTNPENGCSVSASTLVAKDTVPPALVSATNNGPLTCATTEVTLTASSSTGGVSYSWSGPNDFTSNEASPEINELGTYSVVITHPINGCTATESTIVEENVAEPGAGSSAAGIFNCNTTSLILTAVSPTNNVSYSWIGPGGFTSINQSPEVTVSGTYEVTVTDPVNGCVSTSSVTTGQDTVSPGVLAAAIEELTCATTSVFLEATSSTQGVEYNWSGPDDFSSTEQYPSTTKAGDYFVVATDPTNGCTSIGSITLSIDTIAPENVLATVSDTISCTTGSVTLSASSATIGVNYSWKGPGNFSSQNQNQVVSSPGYYKLTVTNPLNGCVDTTNVNVAINTTPPQDVSATASSMLNCIFAEVTLMANTSTGNVGYSWSGPGFSSTSQSPVVSQAGTYTLVVTDLSNGCSESAFVQITKNINLPAGISTSVSGELTCENTGVIVSASSTTPGVEYSWTGPDNFTSTDQNPVVTEPGDYIVTIINPDNGCSVVRTLTVIQNITTPANVVASASGDLTCSVGSVNLLSSSSTSGVSFGWVGPGGFTSGMANPSVSEPGDYTLTVTKVSNGCAEMRTVTVLQDIAIPADIETFVGNVLDCSNEFTNLEAGSSTSGVIFTWNGPSGFSWDGASAITLFSGEYVLTVSNPTNGCSTTDTVMVYENKINPDVTVNGATITCRDQMVNISAGSTTANVTYLWSENVTLSDRTLANVNVDALGEYTVTVTNPVNGCINTATANVGLDNTNPELTASADGTLTCSNLTVELSATSTTPDAIITWAGFPGQNPVNVGNPGTYPVSVENPVNGCQTEQDVVVLQNIAIPNLSVSSTDPHLTCFVISASLTASTSTPETTLQWTGFGLNENPVAISTPGIYRVIAKATDNDCINIDSVVITQDIQVPDLTTTGATITCREQLVTISASSLTPDVSYLWSDNVISDPTQPDAYAITAEDYTVTVTSNINGCINSATVTVGQNTEQPVCNIITPSNSPIELQNDTIAAQQVNNASYLWSITSATGWSIVSGQGSDELIYQAGAAGTSGTFSLKVTSNENDCYSVCNKELVAVAPESTFAMQSKSENTTTLNGELSIEDLSVNIYPNPFVDEASIAFTANRDDHVIVDIYSANGVLFKKLFDKEVKQSAVYKIVVNGNTMGSGTYYCIIKTNNKVYTRTLMLIK